MFFWYFPDAVIPFQQHYRESSIPIQIEAKFKIIGTFVFVTSKANNIVRAYDKYVLLYFTAQTNRRQTYGSLFWIYNS